MNLISAREYFLNDYHISKKPPLRKTESLLFAPFTEDYRDASQTLSLLPSPPINCKRTQHTSHYLPLLRVTVKLIILQISVTQSLFTEPKSNCLTRTPIKQSGAGCDGVALALVARWPCWEKPSQGESRNLSKYRAIFNGFLFQPWRHESGSFSPISIRFSGICFI